MQGWISNLQVASYFCWKSELGIELRFEAPVAKSFCELTFEMTSYKKLLRDELPGIKKTCKLP